MGGFKTPSKQAQDLNRKSLGEIVSIFRKLPIPDPAEWVGPKRQFGSGRRRDRPMCLPVSGGGLEKNSTKT